MGDERLLPPPLRDDRGRALLGVLDRLEGLDLGVLLMRRLDSAPAAALPLLADELQLTGLSGYDVARVESARRELLRQGLSIHRVAGTPRSIKDALGRAGYSAVEIDEGVARHRYDGRFAWNGEIRHDGEPAGSWAYFRVSINDAYPEEALSPSAQDRLVGVIAAWQPVRSRLEKLGVRRDAVETGPVPLDKKASLRTREWVLADGSYAADGSVTADGLITMEVLAA